MRGLLEDLASPNPLERALPGMLQDDDFACRLVGAFDTVVAPVFAGLDNLPAYLDPDTAPEDFLEWLAGWFGLELDATWAIERRRAAVREVVDLYRWRGTARGLRAQLELYLGVEAEIDDGGGVRWSPTSGAALPGGGTDRVVVRLRVADPDTVDRTRLEAMVRAVAPAHLACEVEVLADAGTTATGDGQGDGDEERPEGDDGDDGGGSGGDGMGDSDRRADL